MTCECKKYVCENNIYRPGESRFRQSLVKGVPTGKVEELPETISECPLNKTIDGGIDLNTRGYKKRPRYSIQCFRLE